MCTVFHMLTAIEARGSPGFASQSGQCSPRCRISPQVATLRTWRAAFSFRPCQAGQCLLCCRTHPAKILNQFFFCNQGLSPSSFFAREAKHPDWSGRLRDALRDPSAFETLVLEKAAQISAS